jgi:protein NrfC
MTEPKKPGEKKNAVLRRDFLVGGGSAIAAGALGAYVPRTSEATPQGSAKPSFAPSTGYLVYDSRLCLGCQSCMFACSMTHEGEASLSLSRIQIIRDAPGFTKYPYDITMAVCRQCLTPLCVQNCPTGACHVDKPNGNVRMIDESKCIGCKTCIIACPQRPHRTVWNAAKNKSTKCDLCAKAPFWSEPGGPDGHQACVEICPAKAIRLVKNAPPQSDIAGYDIDLAPPPAAPKTVPAKSPVKQE